MLAAGFGRDGGDGRKMTLRLRASVDTKPLCQLAGWEVPFEELKQGLLLRIRQPCR